ncbi:MAG TPA: 3'-5' exonuclease [Segetibacter sp.]
MNDYLLFLDTETSGLPKNWNLPYSAKNNWPFCLQVSWVIYTKDGQQLKRENHYIKDETVAIAQSATKIHGITRAFLNENGQDRKVVMELLHADLIKYHPLVLGHFMEFDRVMIGADFYRTEIENLVQKETTFCTMLASTHLIKNPTLKFLRLGQLYETLFDKKLENQHNALVDAEATAACFFELLRRGEIDENTIKLQQQEPEKQVNSNKRGGCVPALAIIFFIILIIFFL